MKTQTKLIERINTNYSKKLIRQALSDYGYLKSESLFNLGEISLLDIEDYLKNNK